MKLAGMDANVPANELKFSTLGELKFEIIVAARDSTSNAIYAATAAAIYGSGDQHTTAKHSTKVNH
jgi:hypothetical protein